MPNPWDQSWRIVESLGSGGQGDTFLVRPVAKGAETAVLKTLKQAKCSDLKARARMNREVASLQVLAAAGAKVPKVHDGNTERMNDLDTPLFFVMEHICGKTLDHLVDPGKGLPLELTISIALDLCATLRVAAKEGITHRDIKPENLLVRSTEPADLYFLDFGLSFNKDDEGCWTDVDETLDNRFLSLPERRGPYGDKRDFRSDLTSISGVVYFLLTGFSPRHLRDSDGKTPNRSKGISFPTVLDPVQMAYVHSLLDRGLNNDIALRFQSIDELEARLKELLSPQTALPQEDFVVLVKQQSEKLFKVDRVNRYERMRKKLKEFDSYLDQQMSDLCHCGIEGFTVGWAHEQQRHNLAVNLGVVWTFVVSVGVHGHNIQCDIRYRIEERGIEYHISRQMFVGSLKDSEIPSEQRKIGSFLPPELPSPEPVIRDIKAAVIKAMEASNNAVEHMNGTETSQARTAIETAIISSIQAGLAKKKRIADAFSKAEGIALPRDLGLRLAQDHGLNSASS